MLTGSQIQKITKQVILGIEVTEKGPEVEEFVKQLREELAEMKKQGISPDIPSE